MKFEKGKVYTHKNMLDMVIYIKTHIFQTCDYVELDIKWFNRRGLDINTEETIRIKNEDLNSWYEWKGNAS